MTAEEQIEKFKEASEKCAETLKQYPWMSPELRLFVAQYIVSMSMTTELFIHRFQSVTNIPAPLMWAFNADTAHTLAMYMDALLDSIQKWKDLQN